MNAYVCGVLLKTCWRMDLWEGSEWEANGYPALREGRGGSHISEFCTKGAVNTREGGNVSLGHRKEQWGQQDLSGKNVKRWKLVWTSFSVFSIAQLRLVLVHNDFPSTTYLKINQCFHQSLCTCNCDPVFKMQLLRITQDCLHFCVFFPDKL